MRRGEVRAACYLRFAVGAAARSLGDPDRRRGVRICNRARDSLEEASGVGLEPGLRHTSHNTLRINHTPSRSGLAHGILHTASISLLHGRVRLANGLLMGWSALCPWHVAEEGKCPPAARAARRRAINVGAAHGATQWVTFTHSPPHSARCVIASSQVPQRLSNRRVSAFFGDRPGPAHTPVHAHPLPPGGLRRLSHA